MTEGAGGQVFDRHGKGAVGMMTNPFRPPRRHSSEGWNPGGEAGRLRDGRLCRMARSVFMPVCRHSHCAGMDYVNHWIPRRLVPDAALPPAFMQAGLRRNDGEGRGVTRTQNQGCLLCHLPGDRWRQFLIVQQHQLEPNIPISGGNPVHIAGPDEQVAPGGIDFLLILPDCVTIAP